VSAFAPRLSRGAILVRPVNFYYALDLVSSRARGPTSGLTGPFSPLRGFAARHRRPRRDACGRAVEADGDTSEIATEVPRTGPTGIQADTAGVSRWGPLRCTVSCAPLHGFRYTPPGPDVQPGRGTALRNRSTVPFARGNGTMHRVSQDGAQARGERLSVAVPGAGRMEVHRNQCSASRVTGATPPRLAARNRSMHGAFRPAAPRRAPRWPSFCFLG
jgi:hypothetical protein